MNSYFSLLKLVVTAVCNIMVFSSKQVVMVLRSPEFAMAARDMIVAMRETGYIQHGEQEAKAMEPHIKELQKAGEEAGVLCAGLFSSFGMN